MKSHYRVVVIGGGVVGASIIYHLSKMGWSDIALIERSVLTAGSSWHAAGGVHALNADPNISALQAYTIDLLGKIEEESGQSVGMHMTGGLTLAGTPDRWEWLQSAYRVYQSIGIEDVRLVTPEEAYSLCPVLSTDGILGGLYKKKKLIKTIKNSHKSSEKEDWIALAECIRSDQVPASDVAKFFSNKRFYGWYKRKYLRY